MEMLYKVTCCAVILSWASVAVAAEPTKDSLTTVKKNIDSEKAILVDVREKSEWNAGHVEGAIFLPLSELRKGVDAAELKKLFPQDKILYTHCVVGKRCLTAANILEKQGFEVRSLNPGYKELIGAGFKKAAAGK